MNYLIKFLLLVTCSVAQISCLSCPAPEAIAPCVCYEDNSEIMCSGDHYFDLKAIFSKIDSINPRNKKFKKLTLANSAITTLEDNVFGGLSFEHILIMNAWSLKKISKLSLNSSAFTLEEFRQMGENQLTDEHIGELFDALSTLVVVNRIYLSMTKTKVIPDNAFKVINGRQTNLENIHLNYVGAKYGSLTTVGNKAFYYLDNLKFISIANQPLTYLKAHAFDFEKSSPMDLRIHLEATQLKGTSFEQGIFMNSKRPMSIELSNNHIQYLPENTFRPVLQLNNSVMVTLNLQNNLMSCDCKMKWLVTDMHLFWDRILEPTCKQGQSLWDLSTKDFTKC